MDRTNPTWDSFQYLKFARERTLPCRDLVGRIELGSAHLIADLGCGPGNSTSVLVERWASAKVLGIDSSESMLSSARASTVRAEWMKSDIRSWVPPKPCDLIFSNAALQWVPDHRTEVPRLLSLAAAEGVLAFQIPSGEGAWTEALKRVLELPSWRGLADFPADLRTHGLDFYYDLISPHARRVDLWETTYLHILEGPEAVVEWTRGTALRPVLERLSEESHEPFLSDYRDAIARAYPRRPDGKVLFPFLRRFVVAYR